MLMRAMQGMVHALCELQAPIAVKPSLMELGMVPPHDKVPEVLSLLQSELRANTAGMARHLMVTVLDHEGADLVRLELPSRAVDELEDLIPEDTRARMKEQNVELDRIKCRVQQSGYVPQILFEAETRERRYRVWLQ